MRETSVPVSELVVEVGQIRGSPLDPKEIWRTLLMQPKSVVHPFLLVALGFWYSQKTSALSRSSSGAVSDSGPVADASRNWHLCRSFAGLLVNYWFFCTFEFWRSGIFIVFDLPCFLRTERSKGINYDLSLMSRWCLENTSVHRTESVQNQTPFRLGIRPKRTGSQPLFTIHMVPVTWRAAKINAEMSL